MKDEDLKVGVVGLGKMGLLHAGILNVLPGVHVVAFCEKSRMLRRFLGKVFKGIRVVDDVAKLVDLSLDMVYVTTPIPSHFVVVKTVCRERMAGSLFVEKTLASNYGEAEELCRLAEGLGGVDMVGYLRRFGVTFGKAKSLLDEDAIGEVSSFRSYAYSSDFLGERLQGDSPRSGVLRDLGCHCVDLAMWFFGDLKVESAEDTSVGGCGDSLHFKAGSHSGLEGEFDVSWCKEGYRMAEVGFSIRGTNGVLEVNDDKVELKVGDSSTWYRHDLEDNVSFWLGLPEYYREDLHFVRSVVNGGEAAPSFHDASKVDKVIEEVQRRINERE